MTPPRDSLEVLKAIRYLKGHSVSSLSADSGELEDPTATLNQYGKASRWFPDDTSEGQDDCESENREQSSFIL